MKTETKEQIILHRTEIEQELADLLRETGSDFALADIKQIIYDEEGQDDLNRVIMMFDTGQGAVELNNIMEVLIDAWNYFPHKVLDGLSPAEKSLRHN
jgi:hypothetical protein